tara:strand:+ start:260 stop:1015 length:756 start_codon:yes stop_codon:yes gene_type:complete
MKLGLFGGGFKPFTTGHFSKLSLALQENDKVIFFYSTASRQKGSGFNYTQEMASQVFDIVSGALKRVYGDKIIINPIKPNSEGVAESTPIRETFKIIDYVAKDDPQMTVAYGINPSNVQTLTIYSDPRDIKFYTKNIGTQNEQKYFGDLVKTGRLRFDSGLTDDGGIDRMISSMRTFYPGSENEELESLISVRGTQVRACVAGGDCESLRRYLPDFLNTKEKNKIIDIMFQKPTLTSESLLRAFIKTKLVG